jgi:hypothetical protein
MKMSYLDNQLSEQLGCQFSKPVKISSNTNENTWYRVYILDSSNASIGEITFKNNQLYHYKSYKKDCRRDLDETDMIFYRFERYIQDETIISLEMYESLIDIAQAIVDKDLKDKIQWRKDNPKFDKKGNKVSRRKLEGRNIRFVLRTLINNVQINDGEFAKSISNIIQERFGITYLFEFFFSSLERR